MEAVTSTDYNSANLSRNFNQVGFNTYNYSQFEQKLRPKQILKYGEEEYTDYGHNSPRNLGKTGRHDSRNSVKHPQEGLAKFEERYARSQSQPERQHQAHNETRSKSQDSRELTFYEIHPPGQKVREHESQLNTFYRPNEKPGKDVGKSELKFYEIDCPPPMSEKVKEVKFGQSEKPDKREGGIAAGNQGRGNPVHVAEGKSVPPKYGATNEPSTDNQPQNYKKPQSATFVEPPKYRPYDRPPRYQETPPKADPPPKYLQDPPKYSEVTKRHQQQQEESKRAQV